MVYLCIAGAIQRGGQKSKTPNFAQDSADSRAETEGVRGRPILKLKPSDPSVDPISSDPPI
jgi:hypothetical protein